MRAFSRATSFSARVRPAADAVRRAAGACALALALLAAPAGSQQDLTDLEKRLAEINAQAEALRVKIAAAGQKETTLLSELERLSLTKSLIRKELDARSLELRQAADETAVIRRTIEALRVRLQDSQRAVEKTLVTLYKYGRFDFLQFLFDAGNISALFSESRHLGQLANYQQGVLAAHFKTMAELRAAEASLETKRREWQRLVDDSNQKKRELETQEAASRELIRRVRNSRKTFERALDEQKDRAE